MLSMPANVSNSFAGCKITSISFCPFITSQTTAKIVISTEIGGTPLYTQTVTGVKSHEWSNVTLDTPFEIPAGQSMYIGYSIDCAQGDYPLGYYYTSAPGMATTIDPILDYIACNNNKGNFTTGLLDTQTYTARRQTANWMLYATIEGNIPTKGISLDKLSLSKGEYCHPSDSQVLTTTITNVGTETLTTFNLTLELDGVKKIDGSQSITIAPFWEKQFHINLPAMGVGLHTISITVDNPDGLENSFTGDHTLKKEYLVYADSVQKTVLIEHFTTARCKNCVAGEENIKNYIEKSLAKDNYIQVNHHAGYTYDAMTTDEDKAYEWFYGEEKGGSKWAPANMVERRDFTAYGAKGYGGKATTGPVHGTSGAKTDSLINVAYRTPGFITLDVKPTLKSDSLLTVKVKGASLYDLPAASRKRLNVFIIEDGVAYPQASDDTIITDYLHNNVFRKAFTGTWGEANIITDKALDRTYTCTLDPAWNAENLRIVAFVSDYDSLDNTNCQVYQAVQAKVEKAEAVSLPFILAEEDIANAFETNYYKYGVYGWMYMSKYGAWIYSLMSSHTDTHYGKGYLWTTQQIHLPAGKVWLQTTGTAVGDDCSYEVYIADKGGALMADYATKVGESGLLRNVLNTEEVDTTTIELAIPEQGDYVVALRALTHVKGNQIAIATFQISEDEPDGIFQVNPSNGKNAPRYNLNGQKIGENYHGIYIQNGKKLLSK